LKYITNTRVLRKSGARKIGELWAGLTAFLNHLRKEIALSRTLGQDDLVPLRVRVRVRETSAVQAKAIQDEQGIN
jgi:hypothetical protein